MHGMEMHNSAMSNRQAQFTSSLTSKKTIICCLLDCMTENIQVTESANVSLEDRIIGHASYRLRVRKHGYSWFQISQIAALRCW
jgi:hypothetical protein